MIQSMIQSNDADIIIVGGGISGTVCFRELSNSLPNAKTILLEARDRLGGRTCTEYVNIDGVSYPIDTGGQWLGAQHKNMLDIVKEMNLELLDQSFPSSSSSSSSSSSLVEICYYQLKELDEDSKEQVRIFQNHMNNVHVQIQSDDNFDSTYYSNVSFYDEVIKYCTSIAAQEEFLFFLQTVLAIDPKKCSFLFFIYYVFIFSGGMEQLGDGPDGCQALKVKGGTQQISTYLANQGLKGENKVCLNSCINFIDYSKDLIEVRTTQGTTFNCKKLILALSPSLFSKHISFLPPLEDTRMKFYTTLVMGKAIKVIIVFDEAFWKLSTNKASKRVSEIGIVHNVFDTMVGPWPGLVCLITGNYANEYHEIENFETRRDLVLQQIKSIYSNYSEPKAYIEKDWIGEQYSGGCFASIVGTRGQAKDYEFLNKPIDNRIFLSCSESSEHYYGYMEGAAISGSKTALAISQQYS